MSLNYVPLKPVLVRDPRVILDNIREYAVLQSGKRTTMKNWTSTSVSTSNINFSCPPPSASHIVDRRITLTLPVRLILYSSAIQPQYCCINPGLDAPRAYPIASALDTVSVSINNCTVTQNMGEIIHALMHFNSCDDLVENDYSETPGYMDCCQNYHDLYGTNRSPLSMAGSSPDGSIPGRGSYSQYHVVYNFQNENAIGGADQPGYAVVDCVFTEQLYISPLYWGKWEKNGSGFTNMTSMDFVFNFLTTCGNRFWSHDGTYSPIQDNNVQVAFSNFNNLVISGVTLPGFFYGPVQPFLNINYITPSDNLLIGPHTPISYPYFDVAKYATDTNASLSYPNAHMIQSNNLQLSSIPRRVYVYARESNSTYYLNPQKTDTFYAIDNLNVQFCNNTGIFAQATPNQLWQMTRGNHCNISWQDWCGRPYYKEGGAQFQLTSTPTGPQVPPTVKPNTGFYSTDGAPIPFIFGGTGAVVCFEFATDIGLDATDAPGIGNSNYNLQVSALVRNCDPSGQHDNVNVSLYIIVVSEGTLSIVSTGAAVTQLSILTPEDVLNARVSPWVNYNDVQEVNGGNFMSGLKSFGNKLIDTGRNIYNNRDKIIADAKKANKFLKDNKVISRATNALSYIPGPQSGAFRGVSDAASHFGYGYDDDDDEGGVLIGGRRMSRQNLKSRARRV